MGLKKEKKQDPTVEPLTRIGSGRNQVSIRQRRGGAADPWRGEESYHSEGCIGRAISPGQVGSPIEVGGE